jgi:hypothetical protein
MSTEAAAALQQLAYGASAVVAFVSQIAVIVVIATVVRRHRQDAYKGLLAWAVASLGLSIASMIAYPAVAMLTGRDSVEAMLRGQAILTLLHIPLSVFVVVLLVRGLVAIAQPPKHAVMSSDAPYR